MFYYKSPNFQVSVIDDKKYETLLPDGSVEITEDEANFLRSPPSKFHTLNNDGTEWKLTPENQALKDVNDVEVLRLDEFEQERELSGLNGVTVQQANNWIDGQIDPVMDLDELKTACKKVFKKIAVFML